MHHAPNGLWTNVASASARAMFIEHGAKPTNQARAFAGAILTFAAVFVIQLGGCASWFLRGAETVRSGPTNAVAVYTAPTCVGADGNVVPGADASYSLAQEGGRWVLYEMSTSNSGTRITNAWADHRGQHFFVWVRTGPGYQFTFPSSPTQPPARLVFLPGAYNTASDGPVVQPAGVPAMSCVLLSHEGRPNPFARDIASTAGPVAPDHSAPATVPPAPPPAQTSNVRPSFPVISSTPLQAETPPEARTSVPRCLGDDVHGAQEAAARGRALYREGVSEPSGPDRTRIHSALAEFDRQCQLGDDWALELRASALFVLGRHLEAIESLDAFLVVHPPNTLPSDVRARVNTNLPLFEEQVATLRPTANVPDAQIRIHGGAWIPLQGSRFRLEPGNVRVEVGVSGRILLQTHPHLVAGETYTPNFDVASRLTRQPLPSGTPTHPIGGAERADSSTDPPREPELTAPGLQALEEASPDPGGRLDSPDERQTPTGGHEGGSLVPWIVTTGILAALSLGGAVPLFIVSENQYAQYLDQGCPDPSRSECQAALDESDTTLTLSVTLFIAGGISAALAITLGIMQAAAGSREEEPSESFVCLPGLLGAGCLLSF